MIYAWGNIINGVDSEISDNQCGGFFVDARDFTNNVVKPGYTPLIYPHPLVSGGGSSPVFATIGGVLPQQAF